MSSSELFTRIDFPDIIYKFQISKDEGKFYIYYFDMERRVEITKNDYETIRRMMKGAVGAFNDDNFIESSRLTKEITKYWKKYFPTELIHD